MTRRGYPRRALYISVIVQNDETKEKKQEQTTLMKASSVRRRTRFTPQRTPSVGILHKRMFFKYHAISAKSPLSEI